MKVNFYLKITRAQAIKLHESNISTAKTLEEKAQLENLEEADYIKTTAIICFISYAGFRVRYFTCENIHPDLWDTTLQKVKSEVKAPQLSLIKVDSTYSDLKKQQGNKTIKTPKHLLDINHRLQTMTSDIKRVMDIHLLENNNTYPSPSEFLTLLKEKLRNKRVPDKMTFMKFFKQLIERSEKGERLSIKGQPITKGTIKTYKTTLNALEAYEKANKTKIEFDSIDLNFYNNLTGYFTTELNFSANYIGKHIKTIKTILNEATEQGHNKNEAYKGKAFITVRENVDNIYLTETELKSLMDIDLSHNKTFDNVRDLFIAGCYTGLRFSDLSALSENNIEGELIHIQQIKTGDKVTIPILPELRTILNKYNGQLPKAISNQKSNQYIKEICKLSPLLNTEIGLSYTKGGKKVTDTKAKYQHVSTHTARRSFATNAYKRKLPLLAIMAITGHKTQLSFMKYIKVSNEEHAIALAENWENK